MNDDEKAAVEKDFAEAVNMTPKQLGDWLETEDSKRVGWGKDDGGESVGHQMGRRIVELKHTKKTDLSDDDYGAMKKVVGYVKRHIKQGPSKDAEHSKWRYSLMNWGHDPLKD